MSISLIITDAGRAEVINADNTGTGPVTLTEVALGTGIAASSPTQTALQAEFKRLTTISGLVVADDTIHVTVRDETNDTYSFSEFGIFTDSGTLFAVYSAPADIMQKAAASSLNMALDVVLGTLDANTVTFGDTNFANPPASETVSGVARIATQAEALAGTDDQKFITPIKLKAAIDNVINGAPGALDTLNELAAALGDDANFATNVTNSLGLKENKTALRSGAYLDKVLSVNSLLHIQEQYPSGTDAPNAGSAGNYKRVLNTILTNNIAGASLSANQITLPVGTYYIEGVAGANQGNKASIYNETDAAFTAIVGRSAYVNTTSTYAQADSKFCGVLTISAIKNITVNHYVRQGCNLGVAQNDSNAEVYTDIKIWKIA